MKVTRTIEVRIAENMRYVHVDNVAVLGATVLMAGTGRIKIVKLAKGGYSIRARGRTTYHGGSAVLRVDAHATTLKGLFAAENCSDNFR